MADRLPDRLPSLLLFAKSPVLGKVKTRLVPPLSPRGALDLYLAFLSDASSAYLKPGRWTAVLEAEPDPEDPALAALFAPPWTRRRQSPGDLGDRLSGSFRREFALGAPAVLAVGSDHPALPVRLLEEALSALAAGSQIAVVPADDGGYCAIALTQAVPLEPFFKGIPWSSPAVLGATQERAARLNIGLAVLESSYDVDRPEDVARLQTDIASRDPSAADFPRATARALSALLPGGSGD